AMAAADLVICHGGHGTVVRALSEGVPVLVSPAGGDMGENGARVSWAGCGRMLPRRLLGPRNLRLAAASVLDDPGVKDRAVEIASWGSQHDGPQIAAGSLEALAAGEEVPPTPY
ncbi:MAG: glycosyltransferase, partial [bacterium]